MSDVGLTIDWNTLLLSGIGGLAGSSVTLLATYLSHRLEISKQKEKDEQLLMGILQAIHDEIETLWDIYMDGVGHLIETLPDGKPLDVFWPVTQEYFTVYNTNSFFIGRIKDHDLRKLIVSTYSNARGLIDSYKLNNDFVQKHEQAFWIFKETKNPIHESNAFACYKVLIQYVIKLKKQHADVKMQVQELLRSLRKEGVLSK